VAIQDVPQEKTPLQRSVDRFGHVMLFIVPGICALLALKGREVATAARAVFGDCRQHCREVQEGPWQRQRSLWIRMKQRFAHFVMARLDPWIARTQWRSLPD
jgi:hypothetical protein